MNRSNGLLWDVSPTFRITHEYDISSVAMLLCQTSRENSWGVWKWVMRRQCNWVGRFWSSQPKSDLKSKNRSTHEITLGTIAIYHFNISIDKWVAEWLCAPPEVRILCSCPAVLWQLRDSGCPRCETKFASNRTTDLFLTLYYIPSVCTDIWVP